jgi:hypothetical protein
MISMSSELKDNKPFCRICLKEVDYALLATGGTESPRGKVAWTVTVRCHGAKLQEDLLMERQKPHLKQMKFF